MASAKMITRINYCLGLYMVATTGWAQSDSLNVDALLEDGEQVKKVTGAFKSSRVIQAHSIEMIPHKNLDFRILHRFGTVDNGMSTFFGLDQARTRIGFDYGLLQQLALGIGRSTYRKEYDGFVKWRVLQQTSGAKQFPVSIVLALGMTCISEDMPLLPELKTQDRLAYYAQLLIGRKFNEVISFQLSPIILHQNYVYQEGGENTIGALGFGGRVKISKRMAITGDYHWVMSGHPEGFYDPMAIGVDIQTGGHVFQLHFSNSIGMNERAFLVETFDNFFKGEIRFGFNLSRMFDLSPRNK